MAVAWGLCSKKCLTASCSWQITGAAKAAPIPEAVRRLRNRAAQGMDRKVFSERYYQR
jgi:hypothetical protein